MKTFFTSIVLSIIFCHLINSTKSFNISDISVDNTVDINLNSNAKPDSGFNKGLLPEITSRLVTLESDSQRQTTILNELIRSLARLESQRQDIISTIDRSEVRISHRLDDIKGDLGKTIALQDVIREDINKLEQEQITNKIWISEQLRTIGKRNIKPEESEPKQSLNIVSTDIEANLQMVQTTLYSLKRSANQIEDQISDLSNNVSGLMTETIGISNASKSYVEMKSFNKGIRDVLDEMKKIQKTNVYIKSTSFETNSTKLFPKDCKEIQENQSLKNLSGVYRIRPTGADEPVFVFCDMKTDGGGWTVIQSRQDGTVDFYRDWYEYKYGFGNIASEFWLGLENIHFITYQSLYELRIDLEDFEGDKAFAKYNAFAIGGGNENYIIKLLGSYEGDAGDAMSYHISMQFSTKDNDNDELVGENCAVEHTGGWWYNQCEAANLNGQYLAGLSPQEYKGIYWAEWQGPSYSLKRVEMKVRPIGAYN